MTITKTAEGTTLTLALEGRLDTITAPQLEAEVNALPPETTAIVIDLAGLEYLSSAGLRVLLAAQKKMTKLAGMIVKNANETIMEVFEITGFADVLTIQ